MIKLLVENGALVNGEDHTGKTPLFYTQTREKAEYLVDHGAVIDLNIVLHALLEWPMVGEWLLDRFAAFDHHDESYQIELSGSQLERSLLVLSETLLRVLSIRISSILITSMFCNLVIDFVDLRRSKFQRSFQEFLNQHQEIKYIKLKDSCVSSWFVEGIPHITDLNIVYLHLSDSHTFLQSLAAHPNLKTVDLTNRAYSSWQVYDLIAYVVKCTQSITSLCFENSLNNTSHDGLNRLREALVYNNTLTHINGTHSYFL